MGWLSWLFGSSESSEASAPPAPEPVVQVDYAIWYAVAGNRPGECQWKKAEGVFSEEDEAYSEAAQIGSGNGVREVRVLNVDRSAPDADSPILAGRVAEAPAVPGIQKAQKFTFHKDGTVAFESGGETYTYRYTIDGNELWIVWEFAGRLSDQVYRFTPDGFHIVKAKERSAKEWYEFTDLQPNHIYTYTN